MINSITSIEQNKNVFLDLGSKNPVPNRYWLSDDLSDEFVKPKNKKNYKLVKRIGESVVAVGILAVGFAAFIFKGGPKFVSKNVRKLSDYFERKIQIAKLNNEKVGFLTVLGRKTINLVSGKLEVLNNFNTIKDLSLQKILYSKNGRKKNILARVHYAITDMFSKVSMKALLNSYEKTVKKFVATRQSFTNAQHIAQKQNLSEVIQINGVEKTRKQWLEELETKNEELIKNIKTIFSKRSNQRRFVDFKESAKDAIKKYFDSKGFFWFVSADIFKSFTARNAVETVQLHHKDNLKLLRNAITFSKHDISEIAKDSILKIAQSISFKDTKSLNNLNILENDLKLLSKIDDKMLEDKLRKKTLNMITALANGLKETSAIGENNAAIEELGKLKSYIENFNEGRVQGILRIYKGLLPDKEYKKVAKAYASAAKSLDGSIKLEAEDCTGKVRDLLLGSAPTDIISISGGLFTLGYFLAKSDDNNKRISVTLKYGIPALTTIGTVAYANTRLFAGTKSLAFAAATGLIASKVCGFLNDKFLKFVDNQKQT